MLVVQIRTAEAFSANQLLASSHWVSLNATDGAKVFMSWKMLCSFSLLDYLISNSSSSGSDRQLTELRHEGIVAWLQS